MAAALSPVLLPTGRGRTPGIRSDQSLSCSSSDGNWEWGEGASAGTTAGWDACTIKRTSSLNNHLLHTDLSSAACRLRQVQCEQSAGSAQEARHRVDAASSRLFARARGQALTVCSFLTCATRQLPRHSLLLCKLRAPGCEAAARFLREGVRREQSGLCGCGGSTPAKARDV